MMPPQDTTNKLASLMAKVKRRSGIEREPFPYFDVMDFMPDWSGAEQASDKKNMDMTAWLAAYQNFALAASATGMWNYVSSHTHMRICMQIAWEARLENWTRWHAPSWKLAFAYDKLARKKWSEKDLRGLELVVSIRLV